MEMYLKDSIDDLESVVCSFVCLPRRKFLAWNDYYWGNIFSKCELIFY